MAAAVAAAAAASSGPVAVSPGLGTEPNPGEMVDGGEDSDISSDEEAEAIDSDDVDSDAFTDEEEAWEESYGPKVTGHEVKRQLDFIKF